MRVVCIKPVNKLRLKLRGIDRAPSLGEICTVDHISVNELDGEPDLYHFIEYPLPAPLGWNSTYFRVVDEMDIDGLIDKILNTEPLLCID